MCFILNWCVYTKIFCIPEVISVFSSWDNVLGDSLVFHQGNRGSLHVWFGTWNCSAHNARESGLILRQVGSFMSFLEMRQATVLYSRVTARMAIWNSALFSKVRTPVYFLRTPQESILGLAGIYTRLGFWSWGGRPSFSYLLAQLYWDCYQFSRIVRHLHLLKHWTLHASRCVKGM